MRQEGHVASVNCWCRPVRDEEEPAVWVHSDSVRHTDTDTMFRIDEAVDGLRSAVNALTDDDYRATSQMAGAIGCDLPRLEQIVAELRLLLAAMERGQQPEAATVADG
jgi:hypothetical protein